MVDPATFLTIITPIVSGGLSGATTVGLFKGPVKTLEDWWFVNFGASLSQQAALLRAEQEANVEKLKSGILDNVSKIEPENIQEPKLNILGPALEASKYYIEDEELRDMFAKLIAASMDKSKNDKLHVSFVEIIKQMNPLDAENLVAISNPSNPYFNLIGELKADVSTGGLITYNTNLYLGNMNDHSQQNIGISLSNLDRLGLINLSYQEWSNDEDLYKKFEELVEFKDLSFKIDGENAYTAFIAKNISKNSPTKKEIPIQTISKPRVGMGFIRITDYGKAFSSICL